jgi:hypothetical protein
LLECATICILGGAYDENFCMFLTCKCAADSADALDLITGVVRSDRTEQYLTIVSRKCHLRVLCGTRVYDGGKRDCSVLLRDGRFALS